MAEHFCKEHQTVFFKKGKMKGYAHPIVDGDGDPVLDDDGKAMWCNEPTEEKPQQIKSNEMSKEEWADKDRIKQVSIEAQNAYTGVVSLLVAGVVARDETLGITALNYAQSKLSNWSSQGINLEPPTPTEPMINKLQAATVTQLAKEKGYTPENCIAIMTRKFHKSAAKTLTRQEAAEFIEILDSGQFLESIEPENIPF